MVRIYWGIMFLEVKHAGHIQRDFVFWKHQKDVFCYTNNHLLLSLFTYYMDVYCIWLKLISVTRINNRNWLEK